MNTMALTNGGEVYVIGGDTYGQLGRGKHQKQKKGQQKQFDEEERHISLIHFSGETQVKINFIACGGEHLFAITNITNELYGWGRNDDG